MRCSTCHGAAQRTAAPRFLRQRRTAVQHKAAARKEVDEDARHVAILGGNGGAGAQEHHLCIAAAAISYGS